MSFKKICICLILIFCIIGAASAADDVSADVVSDSVDDVAVDAVDEEISDSSSIEETTEPTVSDDTTIEEIDEDIKTDEISEESATVDSEPKRSNDAYAANWSALKGYGANEDIDYTIYLTNPITVDSTELTFGNSATIIGTPTNYITGGSSSKIHFQSTGDLDITFINVTFKDMSASVLMKLSTSGINKFINCSFVNIHTYAFQSSVIWNNGGWMTFSGCNFTNCNNSYGVITNHKTYNSVFMKVDDCKFENNFGRIEPGAINNCGILNVTDCTFTSNRAGQWAGAIHTHSNAYTRIVNSDFTNNVAGWNGGALYSYSKLEVINSTFTNNSCHTSAGGGAIGCSNYGSSYNITICNCNFTNNANLCGHTNETPSTGTGGAISAMNDGILKVCGSTFDNNTAAYGQAIAAYSQGYISPEGNITEGIPKVIIQNNTFKNHNQTNETDTVAITGNYTFDNNTFINCHQENVGTNNRFINCTPESVNNVNGISENLRSLNLKKSTKDILMDGINYLTPDDDISEAINNVEENGKIYLGDGEFIISCNLIDTEKNYTIIGQSRENTILDKKFDGVTEVGGVKTFINLTIKIITPTRKVVKPAYLESNSVFINCTFINTPINIGKNLVEKNPGYLDQHGVYTTKFYNCEFLNCERDNAQTVEDIINGEIVETTLSAYMNVFDHANVEIYNCIFDGLSYDTLICTNVANYDTGSVMIYNSTFKNCVINAVVDYYTDLEELFVVEDCTYDFDVTTDVIASEDNTHHYVNATKLKVIAVDSAVDISSSEKGVVVITLTDGTNPIAGATVKYTVNGDEEQTITTGEDGKAIVSGLTGEVTIVVNYAGNESFNPISDSKSFNFTEDPVANDTNDTPVVPAKVATKLAAAKVSAVYNVAKKLVITLTDKDGKALANKKVTVKVGTISKTLTTNAKGQVSLNVATLVPKTYTATVKFAGDSAYTASTVKPKVVVSKAKPKLAAKAKTFKVKVKTKKYVVTLKNNKGKVMKKVKLTLKVGKKTYKATTNSKGKATFKITKLTKKGKYTATIKFAGSKYYKALSKKAKITVKK